MKPLFLFLCCFSLICAAEQHFWDKQDPSTWTPAQVSQFTTASPWAKRVTAELMTNSSNMAGSTPRENTRNNRTIRTGRSNEPTTVDMPKLQGVVQWISAKPMQQVLKLHLPESLQGHYVVCVSGLPVNPDTNAAVQDTTLQLKRGDPVHPEVAYQDPADTSAIYFGFLPSTIDLSDAKTAFFTMAVSPYQIKTRFNIPDMKYHGDPAF